MSLLEHIPRELSLLIKQYKHPTDCFICKKKTFSVRIYYCSSKTKCCDDCLLKCTSCDIYVSKHNIIAWDAKMFQIRKISYDIKEKIDKKCFNFPNSYYSSHFKCEYCKGLFCHYCSVGSTKIC